MTQTTMGSLVVLLSVIAVGLAAPQWLVQPPNTPAIVLDPLGRPLDTAEVASARALHYQAKLLDGHLLKKRSIGHAAYFEPVVQTYAAYAPAVSHQSRVDYRSSPAVVATVAAAPAIVQPPVAAARVLVGPTTYVGGSAVSHQSRVDVRTAPAVVNEFVSAPVVAAPVVAAEPVVAARTVVAPTTYVGGSAVSHQSRVDVHSSPAVVAEQVVAPVVEARSVLPAVVSEPVFARTLIAGPTAYVGGSAVSHQSRVDVQSSPAVLSEQLVAPAVVEARSAWPTAYASYW